LTWTAGNYCPRASSITSTFYPYPTSWPTGTYSTTNNLNIDQTHWTLWDAGKTCSITGTLTPVNAGTYSPIGYSMSLNCPPGFYSSTSPDGKNLNSWSICPIGKYWIGSGNAPTNCPSGYFCPQNTQSQYQHPWL